jgi:hypothetical protein
MFHYQTCNEKKARNPASGSYIPNSSLIGLLYPASGLTDPLDDYARSAIMIVPEVWNEHCSRRLES